MNQDIMLTSDLHSPLSKQETRSLKRLLADWASAVAGTGYAQPPAYDGPDVSIAYLTEKTSEVAPGAGFVARVRTTGDGHPYIGKAIELGAIFVLAQRPAADVGVTVPDGVVYLRVEDTAEALAWLAAAWEGFPSRRLVTIGVTGTDGKTTTANILYAILEAAGHKVGLLSTIKAVIGDTAEPLELHVTTPEAPVVQRYLRRMVEAGVTHCVLETTSHSLAQHRVTAVEFDAAVVTNITHEHLDYHQSYEGYAEAKARLFQMVADRRDDPAPNKPAPAPKLAVLNRDDSSYERLSKIEVPLQLTYSIYQRDEADVFADKVIYDPWQTVFTLKIETEKVPAPYVYLHMPIKTTLFGEFNVYNILAAAAAAYGLGIDHDAIQLGIQSVRDLHGRMQQIDCDQRFLVHVDFAHTPNALEKAIGAGRSILEHLSARKGRVIAVFGSAGKRDVAKRRMMAEVSARLADLTVLTAEDPRTESLDDILATMAEGCRSQGGVEEETFWRVPDRGQAIFFALTLANDNDLVLICGKGHEQSMCFGATEYPWDDVEATRIALEAYLAGRPMPDLGLPTFRDGQPFGSLRAGSSVADA
ncbi:MAG TPA: UDP-N-acetylmuramoyl-L-alanyl-D-glutamate--2,6-diaminopimelate ligase [Anaerolineae bacterium]